MKNYLFWDGQFILIWPHSVHFALVWPVLSISWLAVGGGGLWFRLLAWALDSPSIHHIVCRCCCCSYAASNNIPQSGWCNAQLTSGHIYSIHQKKKNLHIMEVISLNSDLRKRTRPLWNFLFELINCRLILFPLIRIVSSRKYLRILNILDKRSRKKSFFWSD